MDFELQYKHLIETTLMYGQRREGRNGFTRSTFGKTITVDLAEGEFPLLLGRKIFYRGVFGEFAAFIRGPRHLKDFEEYGCNYWKQWADENGTIRVDYGNQWLNFNGVNQLDVLVSGLLMDPAGRRHIVNAWRPDHHDLSLPCCHFLYQWYVNGDKLEMIWYQRSVDLMIGLPSDIVLAMLFNICVASDTGYKPGKITFMLGDCHVYEEHNLAAKQYLSRLLDFKEYPTYATSVTSLVDPDYLFEPGHIQIQGYDPYPAIKMEVKA